MIDKLLHFAAGALIAAILLPLGAALAAAAVVVAGIGRELVRPPFDVLDLLATLAGGVVIIFGKNWKNTGSPANVWEPGVFGWEVV